MKCKNINHRDYMYFIWQSYWRTTSLYCFWVKYFNFNMESAVSKSLGDTVWLYLCIARTFAAFISFMKWSSTASWMTSNASWVNPASTLWFRLTSMTRFWNSLKGSNVQQDCWYFLISFKAHDSPLSLRPVAWALSNSKSIPLGWINKTKHCATKLHDW